MIKYILFCVSFCYTYSFNFNFNQITHQKITVQNLIKDIEHHNFDKIYFSPDLRSVRAFSPDFNNVEFDTSISPIISQKLIDLSLKHNIDTIFDVNQSNMFNIIPSFFYGILLFSVFRYLRMINSVMRSQGGEGGISSLLNPIFKMGTTNNVTFSDWAGSQEVLEECTEFVTYLKNNTFYKQLGVTLPRGILLDGPPGTGKTLLAKALANESNSTFISVSGSEFIEMFVGVGASRVRKIFDEARDCPPAIIFIDEIDAIGKKRGRNMMSGNDESEQTLNQLLTEMDGFRENENITIIAATNRLDVLDEALLRPGRFDRIIRIPLPDYNSRLAIFKLYLKNKLIDASVSVKDLASVTAGYSGAQIKNLINEACIQAARKQQLILRPEMFNDAFDTITFGVKKRVDTRDSETIQRLAIHEVGHAFMVNHFSEFFDLQRISIQPSYSGVGGFVIFNEKGNVVYTKDLFMKRLMIGLAGKAAETIYYGDNFVSYGASMDLKQANELASEMIEKYGMGELLKVFSKSDVYGKTYSPNTYKNIDDEVLNLVNTAYDSVIHIMQEKKHTFKNAISILSENLTMTGKEFVDVISPHICNDGCGV